MEPGTAVRIRENDAGVAAGLAGVYVGDHEASGYPLVLVEGRRVAFLPGQIAPADAPEGPGEATEGVPRRMCTVPGCPKAATAKGLCAYHYYRARKEAAAAEKAIAEAAAAVVQPEPEPAAVEAVPEPVVRLEAAPVALSADDGAEGRAVTAAEMLAAAARMLRRGIGTLALEGASVDDLSRMLEAVGDLEEAAAAMRRPDA